MKQKNILILVIIVAIIILGALLILRKDIIAPVVFEPDETIEAELCRRVITRAQLKEITGKDNFVFEDREDEFPGVGFVKTCDIRLAVGAEEEMEMMPEMDMGMMMGMGPGISIGFFPEDVTYEVLKEKLTEFMPPEMEVKEVEDIGEKAFSISWGEPEPPVLDLPEGAEEFEMPIGFPEMHEIIFLDGNINQVMGVMVQDFSMEILIELAKQIETNLK